MCNEKVSIAIPYLALYLQTLTFFACMERFLPRDISFPCTTGDFLDQTEYQKKHLSLIGETAEVDKLISMKPACNYSVMKYILNQVTVVLTPKNNRNA